MTHTNCLLMCLAMLVFTSQPLRAEPIPSPNACYANEDLAFKDGEQRPVRKHHPYAPFTEPAELQPFEPVAKKLRGAIRRVDIPSGEKVIALTFDLCEQPGEIAGYDGRIIDLLRQQDVKATLFAGGKWLQTHEMRASQLMTDPLFEIANHSETHRNQRAIDAVRRNIEITSPQRAYERLRASLSVKQCLIDAPEKLAAIPKRMRLFRFPYGACSPEALDQVNDAGLLAIQWDISTGDPDARVSANAIAATMTRHIKPGSIIIAHANGRGWHTAEGLAIAIPKLKAMGYRFATVTELLALGKPVVVDRCYNVHPGDTDRYDRLLAARTVKLARKHARKASTLDAGEAQP